MARIDLKNDENAAVERRLEPSKELLRNAIAFLLVRLAGNYTRSSSGGEKNDQWWGDDFEARCRDECPAIMPFYRAWLDHRYEPRQPASGLFGLAREYFLLRRIAEISEVDPGCDALLVADLGAMKEEFELEEIRCFRPRVRKDRGERGHQQPMGERRSR